MIDDAGGAVAARGVRRVAGAGEAAAEPRGSFRAALKLAAFGLQIDELTPEQAAYAAASDEGTDARDVPAKTEHDDAQ